MQESLNKLREAAKDKDKEIELLYFDETGMANVPNVQRSWSPLGEPHSADASIARKRVNVLGALNYAAGTLAFEVHEHTVCRADVVKFLDRQARSSARDKRMPSIRQAWLRASENTASPRPTSAGMMPTLAA